LEARDVAEVARTSKLNRFHIYRMLGEQGNPTMKSLKKILHAVGLRLSVTLQRETGAA
jgi:DNA-binding phage protein